MAKRKHNVERETKDTTLFQVCPQCGGKQEYVLNDEVHRCICQDGYVAVGYTLERCDKMQTEIDRLLMALDEIREDFRIGGCAPGQLSFINKILDGKNEEIEAARSRTKPKGV